MKILTDIGGTYARFAVCDGQGFSQFEKYEAADFECFEDALEHYKSKYGLDDMALRIATAAYPDSEGLWRFVNNNKWVIDPSIAECVLNDFEAAVAGLYGLPDEAQTVLKAGVQSSDFSQCLLGPGTGLGLGYLNPEARVQKTHGGHMVATAVNGEQWDVIKAVQKDAPVVFENLLSGPGLMNIYGVICDNPVAENPEALLEHVDQPDVKTTLRIFHEFLGLFAHTTVVTGHAYGGLYLTGGVLEQLVKLGLFDFEHFEKFFVLDGVASVKQALNDTLIVHVTDPYLSFRGLINA